MSKLLCIVCVNNTANLKNLNEITSKQTQIITKLRQCVPEVEWSIESQICQTCLEQLENVCAFRDLCIKSYLSRKNEIKLEEEKPPPHDDHFVCFHCEKTFKIKSVLEEHIKYKHTDTKPLNICDVCGSSFSNKYLLKRHLKNVHATEKKFKCELCERKFASPVYLNAHKRYHSGERKHICSFCGKGYITASDLYHHEKIHANKRAYRCHICPKAFNTSSDLHKHKICVHQDRSQWKYECSFCQRRFPLKTNLDTHTKTHTGERNFLCHLCDRKCINRSVLKRHIESHSIVKSFKCNLCLQGYKYQKSLDIHMMKIHGIGDVKIPERIKKYFCSICPKSYFANNKLQKHIRTHTGERPFHCPACDKCFIDKSYIKQHLKTAHNVFE
ncbi:zinc finger protein 33B [Tribolium castaneum]|uniref:zinc finger protein 33B n=1 Tax=Tribolium castaneum TaxID=7070 RepID=UPI00046C0E81|nr:PREDICTED: zinc finger protein 33B [Tribolium castaneum]|eukprot:XP_008194449.1 PREDICTED: zinc finger protein 33B [Tribolium castaneum]